MGPISLDPIAWGERSLYALLFIACVVVMGQWDKPFTYTFLAAVFCLILPFLFTPASAWDAEELDDTDEIPD